MSEFSLLVTQLGTVQLHFVGRSNVSFGEFTGLVRGVSAAASSNASMGHDVVAKRISFTLYLSGPRLCPNTGKAGRKAAFDRFDALLPACKDIKSVYIKGGTTICVTPGDITFVNELQQLLASSGRAEIGTQEQHQHQVEFDARFKRKREREEKSLLLADESKDMIQQLMNLRGTGGSEAERAQFATHCIEVLTLGQRKSANAWQKKVRSVFETAETDEAIICRFCVSRMICCIPGRIQILLLSARSAQIPTSCPCDAYGTTVHP